MSKTRARATKARFGKWKSKDVQATLGNVDVTSFLSSDEIKIYRDPPAAADQTLKKDAGKIPLELLSDLAMEEIAKVLAFGAKKYAPDGWRRGMEWRRLIGAAKRHLGEFSKGVDVDPETGLPHLAHLGCCVMFLLEYQITKAGTDDRYKKASGVINICTHPRLGDGFCVDCGKVV